MAPILVVQLTEILAILRYIFDGQTIDSCQLIKFIGKCFVPILLDQPYEILVIFQSQPGFSTFRHMPVPVLGQGFEYIYIFKGSTIFLGISPKKRPFPIPSCVKPRTLSLALDRFLVSSHFLLQKRSSQSSSPFPQWQLGMSRRTVFLTLVKGGGGNPKPTEFVKASGKGIN